MSIPARRGLIRLALTLAVTTALGGVAFAHPTLEPDGSLRVSDGARDAHQHG